MQPGHQAIGIPLGTEEVVSAGGGRDSPTITCIVPSAVAVVSSGGCGTGPVVLIKVGSRTLGHVVQQGGRARIQGLAPGVGAGGEVVRGAVKEIKRLVGDEVIGRPRHILDLIIDVDGEQGGDGLAGEVDGLLCRAFGVGAASPAEVAVVLRGGNVEYRDPGGRRFTDPVEAKRACSAAGGPAGLALWTAGIIEAHRPRLTACPVTDIDLGAAAAGDADLRATAAGAAALSASSAANAADALLLGGAASVTARFVAGAAGVASAGLIAGAACFVTDLVIVAARLLEAGLIAGAADVAALQRRGTADATEAGLVAGAAGVIACVFSRATDPAGAALVGTATRIPASLRHGTADAADAGLVGCATGIAADAALGAAGAIDAGVGYYAAVEPALLRRGTLRLAPAGGAELPAETGDDTFDATDAYSVATAVDPRAQVRRTVVVT